MSGKAAAEIYRYSVDPASDTAAAKVMRFVGMGKKVLEIGAGPGSISRPLVEVNHAKLTALEIDAMSVGVLASFCERVIQQDLNDPNWPDALGDSRFDAVVIADVLEHLSDPLTTLRHASGLLNEDGCVVVSLPHIAHAAVLGSLLGGDFRYGDWGLLDRTHVRFFAIKNMQALFEDAGLAIVEFDYVLRTPMQTEFAEAWSALPSQARAVLEAPEFSNVYQVVIRAKPASSQAALPGCKLADHPPAADGLKLIAFYLPQFHPIPENDLWWGKGFTEWTNTAKAEPLFPGHYQPHQPADLGYYDLRVRETQREQVALAKRFGIEAFCFHYYWFGGRRLLERPLLDFLADPDADIGFCLSWANENWTRKWDASESEVLMKQDYTPEDDIGFIKSVLPFFADPRYLRVEGKPVLLVYRPQQMPEPRVSTERWRAFCREHGVGDIHLVACFTHGNSDYEQFGYDAGVEFPPNNILAPDLTSQEPFTGMTGYIVRFRDVATESLERDYSVRRVYRTVFPSWDNSARFGHRSLVVLDGNPGNYERWLRGAASRTVSERAPGDRLLFINAWNEWAEGCHLEPDRRFGLAFLEATRRVKDGRSDIDAGFPETCLPEVSPPPAPAVVVRQESYGLRTELAMWGVRKFRRFPGVYRGVRYIYRAALKRG